jgi:hypothetical protein
VRSSRITSPRKSKIMSYRSTKESGTEPARRSCYNKAHDLEHGFHTPASLRANFICDALETDCLAGHVGFEPANPWA